MTNNYPDTIYRVLLDHLRPRSWRETILPEDSSGPGRFLAESNVGVRRMIQKYLRGTYGGNFYPGAVLELDGFVEAIDGFLQEGEVLSLVDIVPVSTLFYERCQYPATQMKALAHAAAAKARMAELEEAILIVFDRNKSAWCAYEVEGDFDTAALTLPALLADPRSPMQLRVRLSPRITQALDTYLYGLNTKKDPDHIRHPGIHPSEFSTTECDRRVAYSILDTEKRETTPPHLRRIFNVGHAFHDVIQGALGEAYGERFRAEVPIKNEGLKIVGSCDGALDEEGFEIKSINDNGFRKQKKAKSEHQKQGVLYAAHLALKLVNYLYANKESGEMALFPVDMDRTLWNSMAARATRIVKSVDAGIMPDRIENTRACEECPYGWTCRPGFGGFRR